MNASDEFLDQLVVEGRLAAGDITPGQAATLYPGVNVSLDLRFVPVEINGDRLPWSPAQDEVLKQGYDYAPEDDLLRQINEILHQELGTNAFSRTWQSAVGRAGVLGLRRTYRSLEGDLTVYAASQITDVPWHHLVRACESGELPSRRESKYRFVTPTDLANWLIVYHERLLVQAEILNAIEGEDIVSKQEAMKIAGLSETQITRYLQAGVIRAWKLPNLTGPLSRGEWLVQRASAEQVRQARRQGTLSALLNNPAYRRIQARNVAEVTRLRREGKLGHRDPLTEPRSKTHPGCYTIQQVANHLRVSARVLYREIQAGRLQARSVVKGGRRRYAIAPEVAKQFVEQYRDSDALRRRDERYQEITAAGLFSFRDLADRWSIEIERAQHLVRYYRVPSRKWRAMTAFEPEDIEAFEANHSPVLKEF